MVNIFLFLSFIFIFTFLVGRLIEKIRVPWVFASLIFGAILAVYNPFVSITTSETFGFLAQLGMYFLLFMIGLEIDISKFRKASTFILKSTFIIIFLEAIFGTLLVHFIFGNTWLISFIVALSFATVGEEILIPILQEFKIVNTKLGQNIIGIGTLDDIIELIVLMLVVFLVGSTNNTSHLENSLILVKISLILIFLFILFGLTYGISKFRRKIERFNHFSVEILFLFSLFLLFLYLGIGEYAQATPIAALLAGIAIKTFVHSDRLKAIESEIKTMCYGFFAPIFFLWVGVTMDIEYLVASPLLILLVVMISSGAKLLGSYIMARHKLGFKQSILLGIGLSVRFSTSIVIIKILFDNGIININLYSVIIASSIVFTFIIPVLSSMLISRWKIGRKI